MSIFDKEPKLSKITFSEFAYYLIENPQIEQWLDQKIQKAVQQLRSGADTDQVQLRDSQPLAIAAPRVEIREVEKIVEQKVYIEKPVERIVEKSVCPVWATDLAQYAQLLPLIRANAQLSALLLGESASDSAALLYWLSRSGQWSTLEQVWQVLAVQVQRQQNPITSTEQQILDASVTLYNQSISRGAAALHMPNVGQSYNYEQHTRVNHRGESVAEVLLAGLANAQGKLVHCALVHTH